MREHYRADINLFYRGMQFQPRRFIRVTGVSQMWGGGAVGSIFKFARDRKVDFTGPVYLYTRQANAHTQYGQIPVYARQCVAVGVVARVFANFIGNRGMQVPVLVPLCPANWNFSPRIEFFCENHATPTTHRTVCGYQVPRVYARARVSSASSGLNECDDTLEY